MCGCVCVYIYIYIYMRPRRIVQGGCLRQFEGAQGMLCGRRANRRPACAGSSGFWNRRVIPSYALHEKRFLPGYALHEKGLQRQIGDGPLVSSQERRAAVVLRINRSSAARQLLVVFPHRFKWDFLCSCFRGVIQDSCPRCSGNPGGQ